jgi:hypothetical protein
MQIKRLLINGFILLNLTMMLHYHVDQNNPLMRLIFTPSEFVQDTFSIWRGWKMFAPNPQRLNAYIDAQITLEDGSIKKWKFPHPEKDLWKKYLNGERYRKFIIDGIRLDKHSYLWADVSRYILRDFQIKNPTQKPREIALIRHWQKIPNWNKIFIPHYSHLALKYKSYTFFKYKAGKK